MQLLLLLHLTGVDFDVVEFEFVVEFVADCVVVGHKSCLVFDLPNAVATDDIVLGVLPWYLVLLVVLLEDWQQCVRRSFEPTEPALLMLQDYLT